MKILVAGFSAKFGLTSSFPKNRLDFDRLQICQFGVSYYEFPAHALHNFKLLIYFLLDWLEFLLGLQSNSETHPAHCLIKRPN